MPNRDVIVVDLDLPPKTGYDDEFVHYTQFVKPSDTCSARKARVRVTESIKNVTCPGCMKQYIAELPQLNTGYFDR